MMRAAIRWGARLGFGIGVVVVVVLSLTPSAFLPPLPNIWDKAQHFLAYGALALCGAIGFGKPTTVVGIGIGLVLLGGGLEIGQFFVAGRQASLADMLAGGLGVAAGISLVQLVRLLAARTPRSG